MNRTLLYAVLAFAFAGAVTAQQSSSSPSAPPESSARNFHHRRPDAHHEAAMLSRRLNLTSDQTAKIEPILADRDQKLSTLHSDASIAPNARRSQMRSIRLDTQQQLAGILTPEQIQRVQSMRHHRGDRHEQSPPTPSGL